MRGFEPPPPIRRPGPQPGAATVSPHPPCRPAEARAVDGHRTRNTQLGRLVLCRLSYDRAPPADRRAESDWRVSNPRPSPWQGDALPAALQSQAGEGPPMQGALNPGGPERGPAARTGTDPVTSRFSGGRCFPLSYRAKLPASGRSFEATAGVEPVGVRFAGGRQPRGLSPPSPSTSLAFHDRRASRGTANLPVTAARRLPSVDGRR